MAHEWARWGNCLRLNARMASHVLAGRWLSQDDVSAAYDRVAPHYDEAWLSRLRAVTDRLLTHLPDCPAGGILDLGCGTAYSTEALARRFSPLPVVGVDVSPGMLAQARARCAGLAVSFLCEDMLCHLRARPRGDTALIVTAWAVGYSRPAAVIREAARVLGPGGVLAFVVNLRDTLGPIFRAFRVCMECHPDQVRRALWPRFPRHWSAVERALVGCGFRVVWHEEGHQPVAGAPSDDGRTLPWLLQTGILAGFDAVLPLDRPGPVSDRFEAELRADARPLQHHYVSVVGRLA